MAHRSIPAALERWVDLVEQLGARRPAVFLDFDGTLAPIAARPEQAAMSATMREAFHALCAAFPVAIVTGRGMADIRSKIGSRQVTYAANHGFEIDGPGLSHVVDPQLRPTFEAIGATLERAIAGIEGVVIEHKGLSIAVHHRLVDAGQVPRIEAAVKRVATQEPGVRVLCGKKVVELRPATPWHKGSAVSWILGHLPSPAASCAVFVGDDRTDEDALRSVQGTGLGLFVGQPQWDTAAHFGLRDPVEVEVFLRRLTSQFAPP